MPCRCDDMDPNEKGTRLYHAARLQVYVRKVFAMGVPDWLLEDAENKYASDERSETELCAIMRSLGKKKLKVLQGEMIASKDARELFTWWEEHQENDKRHDREDRAAKKKDTVRVAALKKLTKAERNALGIE